MATNEELMHTLKSSKWRDSKTFFGYIHTNPLLMLQESEDYYLEQHRTRSWEKDFNLKQKCILLILQDRGVL